MGALIFAKQPLHDDMLITFPAVKVKKSNVLGLIRKGLMSVIESGPILPITDHLRISSSPPLFSEPYPISLVSKIENFMNIIFLRFVWILWFQQRFTSTCAIWNLQT